MRTFHYLKTAERSVQAVAQNLDSTFGRNGAIAIGPWWERQDEYLVGCLLKPIQPFIDVRLDSNFQAATALVCRKQDRVHVHEHRVPTG